MPRRPRVVKINVVESRERERQFSKMSGSGSVLRAFIYIYIDAYI
jgi:hypothetical protein